MASEMSHDNVKEVSTFAFKVTMKIRVTIKAPYLCTG